MTNFKKRCKKGETILETLIAILIITFSSVMLVNLTLTATRMNKDTEQEDNKFREDLMDAEKAESGTNGDVTISSGGSSYTYQVEYFGKDNGLYSYRALNGGS